MKIPRRHYKIFIILLPLMLLATCTQSKFPTPNESSVTPSESPTKFPSIAYTPISTQTLTASPFTDQFQLTFKTQCQQEAECMFAIDIGCLDTDTPCFGNPQELFRITKSTVGPRYPFLGYDWDPTGQYIAIDAVGQGGKGDIFIGDWDGQNWRNITNTPNNEGSPIWSPTSMSLAIIFNTGEPDYGATIRNLTSNGQMVSEYLKMLTHQEYKYIHQFAWASNGKRMAFNQSDENGNYQIYSANLDGSDVIQLTSQTSDHLNPDYSPDDLWIVAVRRTDKLLSNDELILVNSTNSNDIRIIFESSGHIFYPKWSPIGEWITFSSNMEGNAEIYIIRSDGTGLMNVTHSEVDEYFPSWRKVSP